MRYRRFHLERALDVTDKNEKNNYAADILTAIRAFKHIWFILEPEMISNCWAHTRLLGKPLAHSNPPQGASMH